MTFVAAVASPVATRRLRWPAARGASTLTEVPTQRTSHPGVVSPLRTLCPMSSRCRHRRRRRRRRCCHGAPTRPSAGRRGHPWRHPGGGPRRVRGAGLRRGEHPVGRSSCRRGPRPRPALLPRASPTCSPPGSCRAASTRRCSSRGIAAGGVDGLGGRLLTAVLGIWGADGGVALRVAFAGMTSGRGAGRGALGYVGREVFAPRRRAAAAAGPAAAGVARRVAGRRGPARPARPAARAARVDAGRGGRRARRPRRCDRYLTGPLGAGERRRQRGSARHRHGPRDQRHLQGQPRPRDDGLARPRRGRPGRDRTAMVTFPGNTPTSSAADAQPAEPSGRRRHQGGGARELRDAAAQHPRVGVAQGPGDQRAEDAGPAQVQHARRAEQGGERDGGAVPAQGVGEHASP